MIRAAPESNGNLTLATLVLVGSSAWLLHSVTVAHPSAGNGVSATLWVLPCVRNLMVDAVIFMYILDVVIFMHILDAVTFMHVLDV